MRQLIRVLAAFTLAVVPLAAASRAIPAAVKSAAGFCASAANHQSFARSNTGTLGGAFASADHQRTTLGSAFRGARGTRRAAFDFRIVPGAFRLPIAVVGFQMGFHIKGGTYSA